MRFYLNRLFTSFCHGAQLRLNQFRVEQVNSVYKRENFLAKNYFSQMDDIQEEPNEGNSSSEEANWCGIKI